MGTSFRKQRVAEQLQEEISLLLVKELKDPRIGSITITGVDITPDFSQAWVYFSMLGTEEDKIHSTEGLQSAAGYIRKTLGKRLRIKKLPELNFKYDNSLDQGDRIETLLAEVRKNEGWDDPSKKRGSASEVAQAIQAGKYFFITSHANPDGDAIASMLAIYHLISLLGKTPFLYNSDPVPFNYLFLPGADKIQSNCEGEVFDTTIVLDCSELNRVGRLPEKENLGRIVSIDHHLTTEPLGEVYFLDPSASSVGEMIYQIAKNLPIEFSLDLARCIYCSIVSDTGSFRYANTTPAALRCASEMVEKGVSPWEMTRNIFESNPIERWRLLSKVLETLYTDEQKRYASIHITRDMLEVTGTTADMTDQFINYPRGIAGVEIAIQFREIDQQNIKVSFRSSGMQDVAAIARKFGGGGHAKAAGCSLTGSVKDAKEIIYRAVEAALEE